jgi:hypothetical protein
MAKFLWVQIEVQIYQCFSFHSHPEHFPSEETAVQFHPVTSPAAACKFF